jgi:hypothetical protein
MKKVIIESLDELVKASENPDITVMVGGGTSALNDGLDGCPDSLGFVYRTLNKGGYYYEKEEYRDMTFDEVVELLVSGNVWVSPYDENRAYNDFNLDFDEKCISGYTITDFTKQHKYSTDLKEWSEFKKVV